MTPKFQVYKILPPDTPKFQLYQIIQSANLNVHPKPYFIVVPDNVIPIGFHIELTEANSDPFLQYKTITVSNIFCLDTAAIPTP